MTEFDKSQLDKLCRKRNEIVARGGNPPKKLKPSELAQKSGISEQEVINRMRELSGAGPET